jgi:type II secretory pathway pseudopilin PulG
MQLRVTKKSSRGDTIVEVLFAIAISSLAITGAYALASKSLQTGIFATERTEANKLAESQIEALKYRQRESLYQTWTTYFDSVDNFCLDIASTGPVDGNGNLKDDWKPVLNTGPTDILVVKTSAPGYDPICTAPAPQQKYFVNISAHTSSNGLGATYLVTVKWDSVNGQINQSQLYYRFPDRVLTQATVGGASGALPNLATRARPNAINIYDDLGRQFT